MNAVVSLGMPVYNGDASVPRGGTSLRAALGPRPG
jgi:hypothetical protein